MNIEELKAQLEQERRGAAALRDGILKVLQYCQGDICYNAQDIAHICASLKPLLQSPAGRDFAPVEEVESLRRALYEWECCPENTSFVDVIKQLKARAEKAEAELLDALKRQQDIEAAIAKALGCPPDLNGMHLAGRAEHLRCEKEKAERACAEKDAVIREWREHIESHHMPSDGQQSLYLIQAHDRAQHALSTDFGQGWVKSESLTCFKCGDGNTSLYCLNCAREGWVSKEAMDEIHRSLTENLKRVIGQRDALEQACNEWQQRFVKENTEKNELRTQLETEKQAAIAIATACATSGADIKGLAGCVEAVKKVCAECNELRLRCLDVRDALNCYERNHLQSDRDALDRLAQGLQRGAWFDQWKKIGDENAKLRAELENLRKAE